MVISPNKIVQNPEQLQNNASGVPTRLSSRQIELKIRFVSNEIVPIKNRKDDDPIELSIRPPIMGKNKAARIIMSILFPTSGEMMMR